MYGLYHFINGGKDQIQQKTANDFLSSLFSQILGLSQVGVGIVVLL